MARHFPGEALARKEKTDQQVQDYYDPNNEKKFKLAQRGAAIPSTQTENNPIKESEDDHHHVAFAAGRFTGPTAEHHKLISQVFDTPAHSHRIYVMGPGTKEETTEKDPLTVSEKIAHLRKLYPEKADSFIPGDHRHTKNPQKALVHTWHSLKSPGRKVHLTIFAGQGEEGIKNKSSAGGSIESYKSLVDKYNKTRFPESTDEQGNKRGGDLRMDFEPNENGENATLHPIKRGKTSGSVMRKAARELDHTNPEHVKQFKSLLHPGFSHEDAANLMKTIKERSTKKVSESLLSKVRRILK